MSPPTEQEWRETVEALSAAMAAAMAAVQAFVDGHGPRGVELLPLIAQADQAADMRDQVLA